MAFRNLFGARMCMLHRLAFTSVTCHLLAPQLDQLEKRNASYKVNFKLPYNPLSPHTKQVEMPSDVDLFPPSLLTESGDTILAKTPRIRESNQLPPLPQSLNPSVMTLVTPIIYLHPHSLDDCIKHFYSKYPDYENCPELLSADIVETKTCSQTGILYRRREITVRNTAPWLIRKMLAKDKLTMIEETWTDEERGVMFISSLNKDFNSITEAREQSQFIRLPIPTSTDNGDTSSTSSSSFAGELSEPMTLFIQTGGIHANRSVFGPLATTLEGFVNTRVSAAGIAASELLESNLVKADADKQAQTTPPNNQK